MPTQYVEALLLRVDANLPLKTGEPSQLAWNNMQQIQKCFISLSPSHHVDLVNGLLRILSQLINDQHQFLNSFPPEVEENYRQSLQYLLQTTLKCVEHSNRQWAEQGERVAVQNLLSFCAKLLCHLNEKPWLTEMDLIGKLVYQVSGRSFSSVLDFVQKLIVDESDRENMDNSTTSGPCESSFLYSSFSLIEFFDLNFQQLQVLFTEFSERIRSHVVKKSPVTVQLMFFAPFIAKLVWRMIDKKSGEFIAIYNLHRDRDQFLVPCTKVFEVCQQVLNMDRITKFTRNVNDKEKLRSELWPLMMACVVLSPKFVDTIAKHNEDSFIFIDSLRTKLKRTNEYEFVAPILAHFWASLSRLPSDTLKAEIVHSILPPVANELKQFLLINAQKQGRIPSQVEESSVRCLSICLNVSCMTSCQFKPGDLIEDLLSPGFADPVLASFGPTIVAISLKLLWQEMNEKGRAVLATAAGKRLTSFFTQLAAHFFSNQPSSLSNTNSGNSLPTSLNRNRSIKSQGNKSERSSVEENNSACQIVFYFLDLLITAPKIVVLPAESDPGLLNELNHSLCSLLDKPVYKNCLKAIENITLAVDWENISLANSEIALSRTRMLCIPIDAISKRMFQNCPENKIPDYVSCLYLLTSKLLVTLTHIRPDILLAGADQQLVKDTLQRIERALLCRLWTPDISTIITILDCMSNLCKAIDFICQGEDLVANQFCPNLLSYQEMSNEMRRQSISLGRVALQRHILTSLRMIRYPSLSVVHAWEYVYMIWERKSRLVLVTLKGPPGLASFLEATNSPTASPGLSVPTQATEQPTSPGLVRNQRRASNHSINSPITEMASGDFNADELIVEWSHMTYFLAALADAYFKHRIYQRKAISTPHHTVPTSLSGETVICKPGEDHLSSYVADLLRMLVHTSDEKYGVKVERCIRESLGGDLRPPIQSIVIEEAHKFVTKCFDLSNNVVISEKNTEFIGNVTLLFKMMLDKPSLTTRIDVQVSNTLEDIISLIGQYVRAVNAVKLHSFFCSLLLAVLKRRDEMGYRLETKFRAKVIDYLLNFQQMSNNEVGFLQLKTMSAVLARFPLLMDPNGTTVDHQYRLKQLKLCADFIVQESLYLYRNMPSNTTASDVEEQTLHCFLNLLLYNNDIGLGATLSLVTASDARIRASYLDALSRFIGNSISSPVADENSDDAFANLADLVTMLDDQGEFPVVMALVEVIPAYQLQDLARLLTHLFDAKHLLSQLVINVLIRELSISPIDTVLRGSNLASSLLSYSFQTFGSYYVSETIGPIAKRLMTFDDASSYEVNPDWLEGHGNINENRENLKKLTTEVLMAIVTPRQRFPTKLRSLCRCVYQVLAERFPKSDVLRLTGGTLIFLRFINPFLTSSFEFGLCDRPSKSVQRAFTLVAKLLQSAANGQPLKEQHMKPLDEFTKSLRTEIDSFVDYLINSNEGAASSPAASSLFFGECVRHSLHYFLYTNQERVADCLRERRLIGKKPLDKLESLLNKLGPVELSFYLANFQSNSSSSAGNTQTNSGFGNQSLVANDRLDAQILEEVEKLREAKVFYHYGQSAAGNPVFYFVPKHTRFD